MKELKRPLLIEIIMFDFPECDIFLYIFLRKFDLRIFTSDPASGLKGQGTLMEANIVKARRPRRGPHPTTTTEKRGRSEKRTNAAGGERVAGEATPGAA